MFTENQKKAVIELVKAAGEKIMAIYAHDFDVDYKEDIINNNLEMITKIRILKESGFFNPLHGWQRIPIGV